MRAPAQESYRLSDYAFDFPPELIAMRPVQKRDSARLLVLDRATGRIDHRTFADLPYFLRAGDCLVLNRSKVLPARLTGRKATGGKVELLLVEEKEPDLWDILSTDLKSHSTVLLPQNLRAQVEGKTRDGLWTLRFSTKNVRGVLEEYGRAPLPPYILKRRRAAGFAKDSAADRGRYQTVYAREPGSIAAPTAGLHFTDELIARLKKDGVRIAEILLHVGLGTFRPVTCDDVRRHPMAEERFEIPRAAAETIAETRLRGGRFVPVGTTAVRTLETWVRAPGVKTGSTGLFITPGHEFRSVGALVTNFHQPASTPILLAAAFAGRERLLAAYREAVAKKYRLFSYGDAMLIQ